MFRKKIVSGVLFTSVSILLGGVFTGQTFAQQKPPIDALEGLDPVMLTRGKEVQGEMDITVKRGQFRYMFANAETKAAFEQDPTRYEIQLNGACARMGAPTYGSPDLYSVFEGRIYIFGSGECKKRFDASPEKFLESKGESKTKIAFTPEALKSGQALIEKAVAAMGGAARIDGATSYQEKSASLQSRRDNDVEIKTELKILFPDRIRMDRSMPDYNDASVTRRMALVIIPGEAFGVAQSAVQPMNDVARIEQEKEIRRRPLSILRSRMNLKPVAIGPSRIGEMAVEQVAVEIDQTSYTLGLDPSTGRLMSLSYRRHGPDGVVGQLVQVYSDFRSVEGLTLPFKITATIDGQPWKDQSSTIEAITINGTVDRSLFEKPQTTKPQ